MGGRLRKGAGPGMPGPYMAEVNKKRRIPFFDRDASFFVTFWRKAALDVFRGRRTVYSQLTRRGDKPRAGNLQRRNRT